MESLDFAPVRSVEIFLHVRFLDLARGKACAITKDV